MQTPNAKVSLPLMDPSYSPANYSVLRERLAAVTEKHPPGEKRNVRETKVWMDFLGDITLDGCMSAHSRREVMGLLEEHQLFNRALPSGRVVFTSITYEELKDGSALDRLKPLVTQAWAFLLRVRERELSRAEPDLDRALDRALKRLMNMWTDARHLDTIDGVRTSDWVAALADKSLGYGLIEYDQAQQQFEVFLDVSEELDPGVWREEARMFYRGLTRILNAACTQVRDTLQGKALAECSICFEHGRLDSTWTTLPICGHVFHTACIGKWRQHTCPNCRAEYRPL